MTTIRAWAGGALLALLATLMLALPASAHAELESSDPADGATLAEPPTAVSFTFGEDLLDQGNAVVVTEVATGARLATPAVQVDGDTVSVGWPQDSPAGEYQAAFRVVSADGHPIEGSISFTVQESSSAPSESGSPAMTAPPVSPTPVSPTPVSPTPVSPTPVSTDQANAAGDDDPSQAAWILGVGLVVLLAAGGGAWYLRRNR